MTTRFYATVVLQRHAQRLQDVARFNFKQGNSHATTDGQCYSSYSSAVNIVLLTEKTFEVRFFSGGSWTDNCKTRTSHECDDMMLVL
jgi:hypothetical protein